MKVPQAVCFWFNDFNVVLLFLINGISLGRYAEPVQLTSLSILIPVKFVNLKNGPRHNLGVIWIEGFEALYDFIHFSPSEHALAVCCAWNLKQPTLFGSHYAKRICITEQIRASCPSYSSL